MFRVGVAIAIGVLAVVVVSTASAGIPIPTPTPDLTTVPAAPSNLRFEISTGMTYVLWADRSNNEAGFRLEKQVDGGWVVMATYAANTTSGAFPGISHDEQCAAIPIHLIAFNDVGDSQPSNLLPIQGLPSGCRDTFDFTYTNDTGSPANHLLVTTYGAFDLTVTRNAPGCAEPVLAVFAVDITWPNSCVDPGESVEVQFDLISPYYWGDPEWSVVPTPSPRPTVTSPTPSPTPLRTVTPAALPETGGAGGSSGTGASLLVAALTLMAAGAFTLKRIR